MFSFATMDFPSYMQTLSKFQQVGVKSTTLQLGGSASVIIPGPADGQNFEYVSDDSYIRFKIYDTCMHLVIMKMGETVFDQILTDFTDVKDAIKSAA